MKNEWVEVNLFPVGGAGAQDNLILNWIKPLAEKMESEKRIETFHFLREDNEIRFRIYGELSKFKLEMENWLKRLKNKGLVERRSDLNPKYHGEEGAAGKIGQEAYYVYMESGSKIAFFMLGKKMEKPTNFYHYRGLHFILNSCGFNIIDEINFYINEVLQERIGTFRACYPTDFKNNKTNILCMLKALFSWVSGL